MARLLKHFLFTLALGLIVVVGSFIVLFSLLYVAKNPENDEIIARCLMALAGGLMVACFSYRKA